MKKAHIGNGTKVPHLSYVGDAQLGDHTNIGGGTITANYDGVHKNSTTIGSGCHVGAGNLFVAPVEVGDNVTTGAVPWCATRAERHDGLLREYATQRRGLEARLGALNHARHFRIPSTPSAWPPRPRTVSKPPTSWPST